MKKIHIILVISLFLLGVWWYFGAYSTRPFSNSIRGAQEAKEAEVVELRNGDTYNLTAGIVKKMIAGSEVKMLAYNGSIPGPIIKAPKGSEITINFTNNTDTPTTIHSHGVRVDNAFDGVPNMTQKEIGIGESFIYKIKFPDEGVFWYHPHLREDYAQELGLYGNYIVASDDPNYWSLVNEEIPLVVDDILINDGKVASFGKVASHALMGRFGNVMLVNGSDKYVLNIKQGEVIRFYITNTANTRVFNLAIPGAKMKLVGGDNGKYEYENFVDNVLLSPSERAIVDVFFETSGDYTIEHKTPEKIYAMGAIKVSSEKVTTSYKSQFLKLRTNKDTISSIDSLRDFFDKKFDKSIVLGVDLKNMNMGGSHVMPDGTIMSNNGMIMGGHGADKIEWEDSMVMMNTMSLSHDVKWKIIDQETQKSNSEIDWAFKVGDKVKIKIYNDPRSLHPMQHPIHFHGQRFVVLSTNGVKNKNMVWKDTALIQKGDTVEILVDMKNPGMWMAHCHISEHLESGMMLNFRVE